MVVVLGTAAATVCLLASLADKHPGTWVVWLARRGKHADCAVVNDPLRAADDVAALRQHAGDPGDGAVEFHPQCLVEAIEWPLLAEAGLKVCARCGDEERDFAVDGSSRTSVTGPFRAISGASGAGVPDVAQPTGARRRASRIRCHFYVLGEEPRSADRFSAPDGTGAGGGEVFKLIAGKAAGEPARMLIGDGRRHARQARPIGADVRLGHAIPLTAPTAARPHNQVPGL